MEGWIFFRILERLRIWPETEGCNIELFEVPLIVIESVWKFIGTDYVDMSKNWPKQAIIVLFVEDIKDNPTPQKWRQLDIRTHPNHWTVGTKLMAKLWLESNFQPKPMLTYPVTQLNNAFESSRCSYDSKSAMMSGSWQSSPRSPVVNQISTLSPPWRTIQSTCKHKIIELRV